MCEGRRCKVTMPRATSAAFNISSTEPPSLIGVSSCSAQNSSSAFYMRDAEPSSRNHYDVLGISIKATGGQVRSAFHKLALRWHPDRHHGGDVRTFQVVQEAYSCLSDPVLRHSYDLRLLGLLDVEEYLHLFKEFILTANGLSIVGRGANSTLESSGSGSISALPFSSTSSSCPDTLLAFSCRHNEATC